MIFWRLGAEKVSMNFYYEIWQFFFETTSRVYCQQKCCYLRHIRSFELCSTA